MKAQGGRCAICGSDGGVWTLVLDHDHETNRNRGMLCQRCNTGLGMFYDGALFEAAQKYLDNPPARQFGR